MRQSKIVVSTPASGLTNILWAKTGTSVIEFSLDPHTNNNIAHICDMLGHDYYRLSEIKSLHRGQYVVDKKGLDALVALIKKIIDKRGVRDEL